jgi:HSP20 family protein
MTSHAASAFRYPVLLAGQGRVPHVDVSEREKKVNVVAELLGMEQNDVDLSMHDGVLTIKGEKKSETNGTPYSERWHGAVSAFVAAWARRGYQQRECVIQEW